MARETPIQAASESAGAAKVYATSRTPDALAAADPRVQTLALDITDPASVTAAAAAAPDVTVLVNNAGVLAFGSALDGDLDSFERDLRTNYLGTLLVIRAFVPALERNAPAAVVNVLTPPVPATGPGACMIWGHERRGSPAPRARRRPADAGGADTRPGQDR